MSKLLKTIKACKKFHLWYSAIFGIMFTIDYFQDGKSKSILDSGIVPTVIALIIPMVLLWLVFMVGITYPESAGIYKDKK